MITEYFFIESWSHGRKFIMNRFVSCRQPINKIFYTAALDFFMMIIVLDARQLPKT